MPLELGDPLLMLRLDPIRHPNMPVQVNEENADFLDSASHKDYDFWYGKPVPYGDQTLVVIHFDQKENVRSALFKGTLWIDQESKAFVKIAFGFSDRGIKHLVPGYAKALMWVYGLSYEVRNTLIEFEYTQFNDKWVMNTTRLKASLYLEKRRFFSDNDKGDFIYECEMLTSHYESTPHTLESQPLIHGEFLSRQVSTLPNNQWEQLKHESRQFH